MSADKRALLLRVLSAGFVFLTIFLLASLTTYDANDLPVGQSRQIQNLCGVAGAYVAHGLLTALGAAVYLLLAVGLAIVGSHVVNGEVPRRYLTIVLMVAGLVITILSVWSFDAATDPHRIDLRPVQYNNSCGFLGVQIGHYLLAYVGTGIWVALLSLVTAAVMVIARHPVKDRALRAAGVLILVAVTSAFAHVLVTRGAITIDTAQNLVEGKGGMLGSWMGGLLLGSFGSVGTYLTLVFMGLAGLVLATDTLIFMLPLAIWNYARERRMTRMEALRGAAGRLRLGYNAMVNGDGEETKAGGRSRKKEMTAAEKSAAKAEAKALAKAEKQAAREADKAARVAEKVAAKAAAAEEAVAQENDAARAIAVQIPLRSDQTRKAEAQQAAAEESDSGEASAAEPVKRAVPKIRTRDRSSGPASSGGAEPGGSSGQNRLVDSSEGPGDQAQIGRASWRERV